MLVLAIRALGIGAIHEIGLQTATFEPGPQGPYHTPFFVVEKWSPARWKNNTRVPTCLKASSFIGRPRAGPYYFLRRVFVAKAAVAGVHK